MDQIIVVSVLFNLLIFGYAANNNISTGYETDGTMKNPTDLGGQNRIINGSFTFIEETPWQVAHVLRINGRESYVCSGVIIQIDKILTAAHCFSKLTPNNVYNSYYRSGSTYWHIGGWTHSIKSYVLHKDFVLHIKPKYYVANDLTIVHVVEPFMISPSVQIASIGPVLPAEFSKARISGWGMTDPGNIESSSYILLGSYISVLYREKCYEFTHVDIDHLPEDFFCLGESWGGVGACIGDSGGPVTVNNVLIGIVAAVMKEPTTDANLVNKPRPCGGLNAATLVQPIAGHIRWIEEMILFLDNLYQ